MCLYVIYVFQKKIIITNRIIASHTESKIPMCLMSLMCLKIVLFKPHKHISH